jgi:hypothetical protein
LDKTGVALDAGKKLFDALSGGNSPWTIRLIRASLGAEVRGPKAALVTAINVFNELFWDIAHGQEAALKAFAERNARLLASLSAEAASVLVVEPGIPQSGAFIAALRAALIERDRAPLAPCPHTEHCPCFANGLNHGKAKWCHFAFDTSDAPKPLLQLSGAAGILKERATMSFLMAGKPNLVPKGFMARVISDAFPVGAPLYGRYACSARGLLLLTGTRATLEQRPSGSLLHLDPPDECVPPPRDPKSHAIVLKI